MNEEVFHIGVKALLKNNKGEVMVLLSNPASFKTHVEQHWDLPGGRVKKGHSIIQTLAVELNEELGLQENEFDVQELFDVSVSNMRIPADAGEVALCLVTYICKLKDTARAKISDDEHLQMKWVSAKEAKKLLAFKFSPSFVQKLDDLEQR